MRSKMLIGGLGAAVAFLLATSPVVAEAAGLITSADIANGTIKAKDIKNGTIAHKDLTQRSIGVARGYAWVDQPSTTLGSPVTLTNGYVYNSAGGSVELVRNATGQYGVTFNGLSWDPGNVQVTAYGSTATWCNVAGWGSPFVGVNCYDATGAPADSLFTVAVFE